MAVGVFLRQDALEEKIGLRKASDTCVRLEPSAMSPGVASINFDMVVETNGKNELLFNQLVQPCLSHVLEGKNVALITAGCAFVGKSHMMHGSPEYEGMIERSLKAIFQAMAHVMAMDSSSIFYVDISCTWVDDQAQNANASDFQAVRSVEEALKRYRYFYNHQNHSANAHCVVACRVQRYIREESCKFVVGSVVCVDVSGSSLVEMPGEHAAMEYFSCNQVLSNLVNELVGPSYIPCLLLGLRTHSDSQQQAIQALLYACRVKDIQDIPQSNNASEQTLAKILALMDKMPNHVWTPLERSFLKSNLPKAQYSAGGHYGLLMDQCIPQLFIKTIASSPSSPILTSSSSCPSDGCSDAEDADKSKMVSAQVHDETLKALATEKALTERCAARISRLNECIKAQRLAQEKAEMEARAAEAKLYVSEEKLRHVQVVVAQLQMDVNQMKQSKSLQCICSKERESMNIMQFSSRLSKVIEETKQVVSMKDQYIKDLDEKHKAEIAAHSRLLDDAIKKQELLECDLANSKNQIQELENANDLLMKQIGSTQMEIISWKDKCDGQTVTIQALEVKVGSQVGEVHRLEAANSNLSQELDNKSKTIEHLQMEVKLLEDKFQSVQSHEYGAQIQFQSERQELQNEILQLQLEHKVQMTKLVEEKEEWRSKWSELSTAQCILEVSLETLENESMELKAQLATNEEKFKSIIDQLKTQMEISEESASKTIAQLRAQLELNDKLATERMNQLKESFQQEKNQLKVLEDNQSHEIGKDQMIQKLIFEIEQVRRREAHLTQALAFANEQTTTIQTKCKQLETLRSELQREHIYLHAIINKQDHSMRMLERAKLSN